MYCRQADNLIQNCFQGITQVLTKHTQRFIPLIDGLIAWGPQALLLKQQPGKMRYTIARKNKRAAEMWTIWSFIWIWRCAVDLYRMVWSSSTDGAAECWTITPASVSAFTYSTLSPYNMKTEESREEDWRISVKRTTSYFYVITEFSLRELNPNLHNPLKSTFVQQYYV